MKWRVKHFFPGSEKEFDKWWNKTGGGYDTYCSLTQYNWWNDPLGKIRKRELILAFTVYNLTRNLE